MIERFGEKKLSQEEAKRDLALTIALSRNCPNDASVWGHLGHLYDVLDKPDKARKCMRRAHEIDPNPTNKLNLGTILNQYGEFAEADEYFKDAYFADTSRKYLANCYSETLLRNGEYIKGWSLFDSIRESSREVNFAKEWKGEPLDDKGIAIISEGGAGDVFLMWRYVPLIAAMGARISIITFQEMIPFLQVQDWAKAAKGAAYPFDYWMSTWSFPKLFKTTLDTIPLDIPYLNAEPAKIQKYREMMENYPRPWIGLCWSAGEVLDPRKYRSLNEKQARRLTSLHGATWFNLQFKTPPLTNQIVDIPQEDWSDTAAALVNLDLFISVDTGIMNLAGGMGIPMFTMLGGWSDCKFGHGDRCAWYPTMKLFRNGTVGFDRTVERTREATKQWIGEYEDTRLRGQNLRPLPVCESVAPMP